MSWNGNDLFNSTLMGGMPSGADPHQYLTTDGNGKPHWEDMLAYEESTVEVILPETTVNNIAYGRTWISCPNASKIQIGNTGTFYIDGKGYPYVAIEYSNSSWPSISVQLKLDGKSGLIAVDGNRLMFYDILVTPPGLSGIISIVNNSTTLKTIDPKYLPSGSGGGGVMMITAELTSSTGDLNNPDTVQNPSHTYEEVKAAVDAGKYCILVAETAGNYFYTPMAGATDASNGMAYVFAAAGIQIIVDKNGWMKN